MAENTLQVGDRVFVTLPVEVHTLNERLHSRVVNTRRENEKRTLQGTVVGVPDDHRNPAVAGITTVTEKEGAQLLLYPNYTVELDREQGKSARFVLVEPDKIKPI